MIWSEKAFIHLGEKLHAQIRWKYYAEIADSSAFGAVIEKQSSNVKREKFISKNLSNQRVQILARLDETFFALSYLRSTLSIFQRKRSLFYRIPVTFWKYALEIKKNLKRNYEAKWSKYATIWAFY